MSLVKVFFSKRMTGYLDERIQQIHNAVSRRFAPLATLLAAILQVLRVQRLLHEIVKGLSASALSSLGESEQKLKQHDETHEGIHPSKYTRSIYPSASVASSITVGSNANWVNCRE